MVFFNRLAEIAGEYLRKGSQVYVEGRLQTRKWQDTNGNDRYSTEVVANEMQMLGGRGGSGGGGGGGRPPSDDFGPSDQSKSQGSSKDSSQGPSGPAPDFDSFDDDIPF